MKELLKELFENLLSGTMRGADQPLTLHKRASTKESLSIALNQT